MYTFLSVIYVLVCLFLILVVLLQPGRGGIGGAFGGGSSQTVFGSSGAGNFLTRLTSISAALFMILSATLAYMSSGSESSLRKAEEMGRAQKAAQEAKKKKAEDKPSTTAPALGGDQGSAPIEFAPEPAAPEEPAVPAQDEPAAPAEPQGAAAPSEPAAPAAPAAAPAKPVFPAKPAVQAKKPAVGAPEAPVTETSAPAPAAPTPPPAAAPAAPAEPAAPAAPAQ